MIERRTVSLALVSLALLPCVGAGAQSAGRLRKVALLWPTTVEEIKKPGTIPNLMITSLKELGWEDGENVSFELRAPDYELDRLPSLASELVASEPDVIWGYSTGVARALVAATSTIPIVIGPVGGTTMDKLVADPAHPGGNLTGLTVNTISQWEKCLQLLKEAFPRARSVGVLVNQLNPFWRDFPAVLMNAARSLEIELFRIEASAAAELGQAFADLAAHGADSVLVSDDPSLVDVASTLDQLVAELEQRRLPSISTDPVFARGGGLLALGPDGSDIVHGAANYIDRILRGAKPSELPVQEPTKFQLIVNLKTATTLGITLPPAILLRADEVIE